MPVSDAAISNIDETCQIPILQKNIGQAVISVKKGILLQLSGITLGDLPGFFRRGERWDAVEKGKIKMPCPVIPLSCVQILLGTIRHRATGTVCFMEPSKQNPHGFAKTLGVVQMSGMYAVLSGDCPGDQIISASGFVGQNLCREMFPVEKVRHFRFCFQRTCRSSLQIKSIIFVDEPDSGLRGTTAIIDGSTGNQLLYGLR